MTQEQFDQLIAYMDAINQSEVTIQHYVILIFFVCSLLTGVTIGYWVARK